MLTKNPPGIQACALAMALASCVKPALAGSFTYTSLTIPDYGFGYETALNNNDQVVGWYAGETSEGGAYTWSNGVLTLLDNSVISTLTGINDNGVAAAGTQFPTREIATYNLASQRIHTFGTSKEVAVVPMGINASGTVIGFVFNGPARYFAQSFTVGGGTRTLISVPGAIYTTAFAINDSGTVAGGYQNPNPDRVGHAFIEQGAAYTNIDPPNLDYARPSFITNGGIVGGYYQDNTTYADHGFTESGGAITTYDYPGAAGTLVSGVLPDGTVVGTWWTNSFSDTHGFVLRGGTYYDINVPGAAWTYVVAANAKGTLLGHWYDADFNFHVFIAQCPVAQSPCTQ